MRPLIRVLALPLVAAMSVLVAPAGNAGPSVSSASYPATVRVVVAPVTAAGRAISGYTVHTQKASFPVDCSEKNPSAGAVSPDIEWCWPSAAYAIACWKAPAPHRVLCMRNPRSHKLYKIRYTGKFAKTAAAKPRDRAPLLIVLTDGSKCQIRDGGAWGQPKGHRNLYGAYSCDKYGAAWLRSKGHYSDPHNGIDESSASWTIRTGTNNVVRRHIATAYFVATAS